MTDASKAMTVADEVVAERLSVVREHIRELGRPEVTVVAVTKGFDRSAIDCAVRLGLEDIGENYAQELAGKLEGGDAYAAPLTVHFMGRIQRNKVRKIASLVDVWHSVDRPEILREIAARTNATTRPRVLVQVRPHGDETKAGISPAELPDMLAVAEEHGISVAGLMTIGVLGDAAASAQAFRDVSRLADAYGLNERSMGMSGDYRDALSAGSTMLRLGSVLFGPRPA